MLARLLGRLTRRCPVRAAQEAESARAAQDMQARIAAREREIRPMLAKLSRQRRENHFAPRVRAALREESRRGSDGD